MKVNIGTKNKEHYLNLNPLEGINITNLDKWVDDGECHEIIVENVNILPYNHFSSVILGWCKKLRHGGKIVLIGTDIDQVVKNYMTRKITSLTLNKIIYGDLDTPLSTSQCCVTMLELTEVANLAELKITKKRIENNKMMLEAIRP